jgi:diaminopimelate epimerase
MRFTKMHGLGNDYVYVNGFEERVDDAPALARVISDRHRGVGSDGLILIQPSDEADVRMEMYNADGSRGQMCGNGIRCVAKYAYEHGLSRNNPIRIDTDAGAKTLELTIEDEHVTRVRVNMGPPSLEPEALPTLLKPDQMIDYPVDVNGRVFPMTCVSMGNPHGVLFVGALDAVDLAKDGALVERHPIFPERCNVHFVQVNGRNDVRIKTWERGSGATQACGTGAAATCVAGALTRRTDRTLVVHLPGGDLEIEWNPRDDCVYMTGPAEEVFTGEWPAG